MVELDTHVFRFLHQVLAGGWLLPMVVLSAIGGGSGAIFVLPLFVAARTRRVGSSLAVVLGVTAVLVFVLKRMVARVRPCACLPDIRAVVVDAPTDFSFPSGHAAGSFAFAVFLAILCVKTCPPTARLRERLIRYVGAVLLVLLAIGVGLSRIALGVHFPADVVTGAILGSMVAVVGAHLHVRRERALDAPAEDP